MAGMSLLWSRCCFSEMDDLSHSIVLPAIDDLRQGVQRITSIALTDESITRIVDPLFMKKQVTIRGILFDNRLFFTTIVGGHSLLSNRICYCLLKNLLSINIHILVIISDISDVTFSI